MRALVAVVIAVGCLAAARPARADDREEARKAFALGQAADREGNWQAAIDHYLRANDLVPHPNTVFNIAEDYVRLDKLREAAAWYQRYLDAALDLADRERIARTLAELTTRPAPISVRSVPSGARVKIDNLPAGATPYTGMIKGGFHRITVEHEGRRDAKDITVEFGEPVELAFTLGPPTGTLRVRGTPAGALVSIDNAPAGALPVTASIAAGVHAIRVGHPGHVTYQTIVTVEPNKEADVDIRLVAGPSPPGGPIAPATTGAPGDAAAAAAAPPRPISGYLLGGAAGADLRGRGLVALVEIGVRRGQLDGGLRLGRANGLSSVELLARLALTRGPLAPYLGAGLVSTVEASDSGSTGFDGAGYEALGGVRYDLPRGDGGVQISLRAEAAVRYHRFTVVDPNDPAITTSESAIIVPVMAVLQIVYAR